MRASGKHMQPPVTHEPTDRACGTYRRADPATNRTDHRASEADRIGQKPQSSTLVQGQRGQRDVVEHASEAQPSATGHDAGGSFDRHHPAHDTSEREHAAARGAGQQAPVGLRIRPVSKIATRREADHRRVVQHVGVAQVEVDVGADADSRIVPTMTKRHAST